MDLLLSLLLIFTLEVRPEPVNRALARASARNHGVDVLRGKKVLVFGDSMVNCGVNVYLEPWFRKHGVRSYVTRSWASSTTFAWAKTPKVRSYMWRFDPDIVIIMLGSNELFHPYPRMKIRPIQRILKKLGKRRLVFWVGPPAWKPDKGIIDVMRETLPPGHFFDSAPIKMARQKDGYHPNMRGSKTWALALRRWFAKRFRAMFPPPDQDEDPDDGARAKANANANANAAPRSSGVAHRNAARPAAP